MDCLFHIYCSFCGHALESQISTERVSVPELERVKCDVTSLTKVFVAAKSLTLILSETSRRKAISIVTGHSVDITLLILSETVGTH